MISEGVDTDPKLVKMRFNHYESRRQQFMQEALQERMLVSEQEEQGLWNRHSLMMTIGGANSRFSSGVAGRSSLKSGQHPQMVDSEMLKRE